MPITIDGTGTISGISAGGLDDSIITPSELASSTSVLFGARNKIINGAMDIAQRGTSFVGIADSAYSLDRWRYNNTSAAIGTVTQATDSLPSSNEFQYAYKFDVTTADTSIAAGDAALIAQVIEGFNARDLIGRTFTLSFWVRSTKTGIHCVAFRNDGQNRSYVAEYTVSAANTWEYKTITVSGGLITAGTWNWTNGVGLSVFWSLAVGTTYQTTAGSWQTGNFFATSNQVNCLDSTANDFYLTGVQLEVGSVATPFEHRLYGQELALCQRYYCKTFPVPTAPANNAGVPGQLLTITSATVEPAVIWRFPVEMRATPTVSFYSPQGGTSGQWRNAANTASSANVNAYSVSAPGVVIANGNIALGPDAWGIHAAAAIEL